MPDKKFKIGVAISCYNKGNFVATNLNVFKALWKSMPRVAVSCNDPETYSKLKNIPEINVVRGKDLPVEKGSKFKQQLRARQYDTIKKSVTEAAKNTDYVIHWHADAFAIKEEAIISIIEKMDKEDYLFAGRGFWKDYIELKVPNGDLDDHFFIVNSEHIRNTYFYSEEKDQLDHVSKLLARGVCSEGILSNLMQQVTPEEKIYIYSDMRECEVLPSERSDKRYPDKIAHRTLPPVNFDRGRGFLHCDDLSHLNRIFNEVGIDTDLIVEKF